MYLPLQKRKAAGLFHSLKTYKVKENLTSSYQLAEILKQQVGDKYEIKASDFSDSVEQTSRYSTLLIIKNQRQGLLLTLHPCLKERPYAVIFTAPYIPNSLLRFIQCTILRRFFHLRSINENINNLDIDIRATLTQQLNAESIDSRYATMLIVK